MASIDVENIDVLASDFENKMGFTHDSPGLEMTDGQLVNFMLLCNHEMLGFEDDEEMMMDEEPHGEVKVIKMGNTDAREMMDNLLGHDPLRLVD
tara:strand:- start:3430 stop:3711 length:282 start_codon:yes stop_codon:yes gene_type:complete